MQKIVPLKKIVKKKSQIAQIDGQLLGWKIVGSTRKAVHANVYFEYGLVYHFDLTRKKIKF